MRLLALAAFAGLLATAAHADTMGHCAAAWRLKTAETSKAKSYQEWSAICLKADYKTAAGTPAAPPPNATAKCKDGTFSMSQTHSGACSHHGGVATWLK